MKKSKLFVLLPMVALLLSGCQTEVVPSDTPSSEESESSSEGSSLSESTSEETSPSESTGGETSSGEYTPSVSYAVSITNSNEIASLTVGDSVVVAVSLITTTDGVDERVSGTASEVTLSCADSSIIGIEGLRITALNEGSTSIYATWTEHGVTSSSIAIEVGKEVEPPVTHEYTYGVSITNGSELSSLTEGDTKTVSVSLITYEDGVEYSSVLATSADVTLSSSATDVVSVSGLELTALSKGTSNISAKWDEHNVSSNAVTVSVSEKVTEEGGDEGSSGSTEEPPYEPTITYKLEITNADDIREIQTGDSRLVEVTGYTYEDDIQTNSVSLDSSSVTLISSDPDCLSVDGLTITAEAAKEAIILTARSETYGTAVAPITVTAAPEPEPEPEPEPVYTYEMTVRNAEALSNLGVGYGYETNNEVELDILLTTYLNGEYYTSYKADDTVTDLEVISYNSEVVTTNGLTVTPIEEGSTVIEVKWYDHPLNGGDEGFSDLSFFINVTVTRYEEPAPEPEPDVYISSIGFTEETYTMVYGETDPIKLDVIYEPEAPTSPSWTFTSDNTNVVDIEDGYLTAKGIGETTIHVVATDNTYDDGNTAPAGTATVVVEKALNPVTSFGLTSTNIDLSIGESATIGLAAADEASNPTVVVDPYPADADDTSFTISSDVTDDYLLISEPTDDLNTYTITANAETSDAGAALHSYVLTITSNDVNSSATRQIYVTIGTEDSVTNPVTKIGFSTGSVTLSNGGSFVLGGSDVPDADVIVSVNEDAYETGWNLVSYDESLLSVTPRYDESTGAFSFVITALEPDISETVMTDLVVRSMGTPVKEAHLAVYILRAEDYTASINVSIDSVSMLTDQTIVLGEDDDYTDFSVSIYNQYNEVLEGASWDASIDTEASGLGVLESVTRVDGSDRLSITTGSNPGTGVIKVYATEDESIYEEINVTVSQQYYDVEQISCSLSSITLTYNEESSPKGSSAYIQDGAVTYWSSKGPVAVENEGFTLEYTGSYLQIEEDYRTIIALLPTGDDGVSVTVRSTSNTSVTTTINVVVSDTTDYGVKTLSLVDSSNNDIDSVTMNVSGTDDSTATLASLGVYVSISPEYASNKEYVVTSSDPSILYVDSDNNITAKASKDSGSATLFVVAADTTYGASDTLEVTINTSYVKADTIAVSDTSLSLTTGDSYTFDIDSNISVSVTAGATDTSYTIESSNSDVISVNGSTISAVGAGTATLTFTSADGATASLTVTVTDPRTVGQNITFYVALTDGSGTYYTQPTYADMYVAGAFEDGSTWGSGYQLTLTTTKDGHTYYGAVIDSVILDTNIEYQIDFEYTGDQFNWSYLSNTLTTSVSSEVEDSGAVYVEAQTGDPTSIIHDNTGLAEFTITVAFKNSGTNSNTFVNFAVDGDNTGWAANGGDACTKVTDNNDYDQYLTFTYERYTRLEIFFGGYSGAASVWSNWNFCGPKNNFSPTWGDSTGYCWINSSYSGSTLSYCGWVFDLSNYSNMDSYDNLLIVFSVDYSQCTSDATYHSAVTAVSATLRNVSGS